VQRIQPEIAMHHADLQCLGDDDRSPQDSDPTQSCRETRAHAQPGPLLPTPLGFRYRKQQQIPP
jgi:hypothetical protein